MIGRRVTGTVSSLRIYIIGQPKDGPCYVRPKANKDYEDDTDKGNEEHGEE